MMPHDFALRVSSYLGLYLPGQRNLSANTIASYRDTFKLLIRFFEQTRGISAERLSMGHLDKQAVEDFMSWLEARGCSARTVNQRLSAVRAFVRYVSPDDPARLLQYQQVLSIKQRKHSAEPVVVLGRSALAAILAQPDTITAKGRRDMMLLTMLYDTAARVSELTGLKVRDVRLDLPPAVTLHGKGRKTRVVPLMEKTSDLLKAYMEEQGFLNDSGAMDRPLFPNPRGDRLTRAAVSEIVSRHAQSARSAGVAVPNGITPHSFRHQKAIDLLESGVNLVYIRDFLGHKSVTTTEIYATISVERKRKMLEGAATIPTGGEYPDWSTDGNLMAWLNSLC